MRPPRILAALSLLVVLAGCGAPTTAPVRTPSGAPASSPPASPAVALTAATTSPFRHVFVIVLENEDAATSWGATSPAKYLNGTLKPKGRFLMNYYGIGHHSLGNYIAMVSGQAPNTNTQVDCPYFKAYTSSSFAAYGQVKGTGCLYPSNVVTVASQLAAKGRTWRGYMEGMQKACQHPAVGAKDPNQGETATTRYATKHNPFVYFRSISAASCTANDVALGTLSTDLAAISTTRNLNYIVPDLCHDGHDAPCNNGEPGGLNSADAFLKAWVPKILASPAYKQDGLLMITFDEAESDSSACCAEKAGPGASVPGIHGPGGGRIGALLMSPKIPASTWKTPFNHYSFLATLEHIFGLSRLGFAGSATPFA